MKTTKTVAETCAERHGCGRRTFVRATGAAAAGTVWFPHVFAAMGGEAGGGTPAMLGGKKAHAGGWPKWPKWVPETDEPGVLKASAAASGRGRTWCRNSKNAGLRPWARNAVSRWSTAPTR